MPGNKGFTLVELLIAIVIFSLVTGLVFMAFSQSVSLWERADKNVGKMDDVIFLNGRIKNLLHSAENILLNYRNSKVPLFIGGRDRVELVTSNPLLNPRRIMSLARIEISDGNLVYSEVSLLEREFFLKDFASVAFREKHPLISGIENGRFSFCSTSGGREEWTDQFDSTLIRAIPRAAKLEFTYDGIPVEIFCLIPVDARIQEPMAGVSF
jgi:prepilin-type N-terminal cleavage/methylation domain-containing protein